MPSSAPITERRYVMPLTLVTILFFLWALGVNLNDILIPHLKKVFNLTDFRSSLIQTAFFGGYFIAAVPAGKLLEKIGYRNGILCGLLTCAAGALLFVPAASVQVYAVFLLALFIVACGQGVLEVAANPRVRGNQLRWKFQQALPQASHGEKWLAIERNFKLQD